MSSTLDVTGVCAVMFQSNVDITTSDGAGGTATFPVEARERWGVPHGSTSMTISLSAGTEVVCMLDGSAIGQGAVTRSHGGVGVAAQVMTGDEVRTTT